MIWFYRRWFIPPKRKPYLDTQLDTFLWDGHIIYTSSTIHAAYLKIHTITDQKCDVNTVHRHATNSLWSCSSHWRVHQFHCSLASFFVHVQISHQSSINVQLSWNHSPDVSMHGFLASNRKSCPPCGLDIPGCFCPDLEAGSTPNVDCSRIVCTEVLNQRNLIPSKDDVAVKRPRKPSSKIRHLVNEIMSVCASVSHRNEIISSTNSAKLSCTIIQLEDQAKNYSWTYWPWSI